MWFTDSHLGCKGTTSKSCRAWSSTYQLHVIYRLLIDLRSVYPCTHLSLSINLSSIYLSIIFICHLLFINHLSIMFYQSTIVYHFSVYLLKSMYLYVYFHMYTLCFKTSSIYPFIIAPSLYKCFKKNHLSVHLSIHPPNHHLSYFYHLYINLPLIFP